MKKKRDFSKIIRFSSILLVLLAVGFILVFWGAPKSWAPPDASKKISGNTPAEKIYSMQNYHNSRQADGDDVFRMAFEDYDAETRFWKFTITVLDPILFSSGAAANEQLQTRREQVFTAIRDIFVSIAKWDETSQGLAVRVFVPISLDAGKPMYGFLYIADKEGLANIRTYPQNWGLYTYQPEELLEIPISILQGLPAESQMFIYQNMEAGTGGDK